MRFFSYLIARYILNNLENDPEIRSGFKALGKQAKKQQLSYEKHLKDSIETFKHTPKAKEIINKDVIMENKTLPYNWKASKGAKRFVEFVVFRIPKMFSIPTLTIFFAYWVPFFIKTDNHCKKCLAESSNITLKNKSVDSGIKHRRVDGNADRRYKDNHWTTTTYTYECSNCGEKEKLFRERSKKTSLFSHMFKAFRYKKTMLKP